MLAIILAGISSAYGQAVGEISGRFPASMAGAASTLVALAPRAARGDVLNGIMARVFASYAQKRAAVPPPADFAAMPDRNDPQTWIAFDRFYSSFLAAHEGGYTENDGNGSPANFGINQGANPDIDVLTLTQEQAKQILYERYWLASGADQLPAALGAVHGDTAVNLGVRTANELLAQSGGDTHRYLKLRDEKYRAIAAASPDKANYLPVWLGRDDDLRELANDGNDAFEDRSFYAERQRRISAWAADNPDY